MEKSFIVRGESIIFPLLLLAGMLKYKDARTWWNGRHGGLRSHCFGVRVQIPPSAPKEQTGFGRSALAVIWDLNPER